MGQRERPVQGQKFLPVLIFLLFLVLVAYHAGGSLLRVAAWRLLSAQRPSAQPLEKTCPLQVLVIREETGLAAPVSGTLKPVVQEGERVAAQGVIAHVVGAGVALEQKDLGEIKAPFAGQVSYHPDGLEGILKPGVWDKMSYDEIFSLLKRTALPAAGAAVRAGDLVVRLANNLHPLFLYTKIDEVPAEWTRQNLVTLLSPEGTRITARVIKYFVGEGGTILVLQINNWGEEWLNKRLVEVEAVVERYTGLVVPDKALVTSPDGVQGVYVLSGKGLRFQQVEVEGRVGEKVSVEGLKPDMEVVVNPFWARWIRD